MTDQTMVQHELRFLSLVDGRCYAFPCDPAGRVDMNQLSDRARNDYLFARALVGRDMAAPAMESCSMSH
jgi:hypothetical protein